MNKLFSKIAALTLGLGLAVGVGAVAGRGNQKAEAVGQNDWALVSKLSDLNTSTTYVMGGGSNYFDETSEGWNIKCTAFTSSSPASDEAAGAFKLESTGTNNVYKIKFVTSEKYLTASKASSGGGQLSNSDSNGWLFSETTNGFNAVYQKSYSGNYASLRYRSSSTDIRTYQGNPSSNEAAIKIWKYVSTINIKTITSVTLSKTSVPANYTGALTATAVYTDSDANEQIVWKSSNTAVATVAKSAAYGVANITVAGEVGETVITAAASHDEENIKASVTLTVTESVPVNIYDMTFSSEADSNDDYAAGADDAAATTSFRNNASGDGQYVSVVKAETAKVYDGKGFTIKFGSSSAKGVLALTADQNVKAVVVEAKLFADTETNNGFSVKVGEADAKEATLSAEFTYYHFSFETAAKSVVISAIQNSKNRFYIRNLALILENKSAELGAYHASVALLNGTAEGCSERSETKLQTAWATLSASYTTAKAAYEGMDAIVKACEPNENGMLLKRRLLDTRLLLKNMDLKTLLAKAIPKVLLIQMV